MILWVRGSIRASLGSSALWTEVTLSDIHLVARLSWRVSEGFSHVPGALVGMAVDPAQQGPLLCVLSEPFLRTLHLGSHPWHGSLVSVRPVQKLLVLFLFLKKKNILLNILDLQSCVEFFCTAKWHNYTYMHSFSYCFSIVVCHRMLNILVLCAIQYDLVVYPSYI